MIRKIFNKIFFKLFRHNYKKDKPKMNYGSAKNLPEKKFKPTIAAIEGIFRIKEISDITQPDLTDIKGVTKENDKIVVSADTQNINLHRKYLQGYKSFDCRINGQDFYVPENGWIISDLGSFFDVTKHIKAEIHALTSRCVDYEKLKYWRYLTPILNPAHSYLLLYQQTQVFCVGSYRTYPGYLELKLDGDKVVHLGKLRFNDVEWYFVEPQYQCSEDEASTISFAIFTAMGLVRGVMKLDECYMLGYEDATFDVPKYINYRAQLKSKEYPYYWFNDNNLSIATSLWDKYKGMDDYSHQRLVSFVQYYESHRPESGYFPVEVLSRIVSFFVSPDDPQQEVLNAAYSMISSTADNLEVQPIECSVAFETLTKRLLDKHKWRPATLFPEDKWQQVKSRLHDALRSMQADGLIDKTQTSNLQQYIGRKNEPSNNQKLKMGFREFGYELEKEEIEVIENRNKVLHGNSIVKRADINAMANEYTRIVVIFHFLLSVLILNEAGYEGKVINHKKWYISNKYRHAFVSVKR